MSNSLPSLYQQFIHLSRYSRFMWDEGRRESWSETIARFFDFFDGHLKTNHGYDIAALRPELEDAVLSQKVMPSMRCVMTAGEALRRENIAAYNCSYVAINSLRSFDEILYILMNGCFHPDTMVKTNVGDKKISTITPNDQVLSYDIENRQFEWISPEWVIPTPHSIEKEKLELEFEDGYVVKCTDDHEFYTINRGWVKAKELTEDDDVKNYHEI